MHVYAREERTIGQVLAEKAQRVGDRPFLRVRGDDGEWADTSYADAHRLTDDYARGFAALGIGKGTTVAVMVGNCPEFLWTCWGLGKLGAVAVPLNTAAKGDQLEYYLRQSGSEWVVAEEGFLPTLERALKETGARTIVQGHGGDHALADVAATGGELPDVEIMPSDPMLIMYTSGTTGPSKGVVSPHSQGHAVGEVMARHCEYGPDDVLYTCLPLFHGNAIWYSVYAALWGDSCIALAPRFSARSFWRDIRESGATEFNALGAMANIIWQLPESPADRDHRVRTAMVVPTTRPLVDGFRQRYGITVTSVFAMTENCAVTVLGPHDPPEKAASAGRVRDHVAVQIADDDGVPLPVGEVGEICIRPNGPGMIMLGYHDMPEATVGAIRDLWFLTGDRGRLDEDGYLYFSERKKEVIRRRGENISAYELETILCKHPDVHEAAAVAVPSDLSEDDVMVYVVPADGASPDFAELVGYCVDNMAYFMVPRYWQLIDELPKTPSQKVEKFKLKAAAVDGRDELWDREKAGITVRRNA
ncbi:AMP-binding protein [Pseudonocardia sp.]|uniref:AMP-binding protein n=2 Tax=Pseudonocardia sp. TaxID=60912 RepID=UPI003D099897